MGRFQDIAVIIPAFNEEKSIGDVVARLKEDFTVIVVNDCSTDLTSKIATDQNAIVVNLSTNSGYELTLNAGFYEAYERGFSYFITCDADGQHISEDVIRVAKTLKENNVDIVIGEREEKARLAEKVFALCTQILFSIKDPLSGLKGYSRKAYEGLGFFSSYESIGTQLFLYSIENGLPYKTIPINIKEREFGEPRFASTFRANMRIMRAFLFYISRRSHA